MKINAEQTPRTIWLRTESLAKKAKEHMAVSYIYTKIIKEAEGYCIEYAGPRRKGRKKG